MTSLTQAAEHFSSDRQAREDFEKGAHFGYRAALASAEVRGALQSAKHLCNLICNSPPETTIKGEIESLAFELGHYDAVMNSDRAAAEGEK